MVESNSPSGDNPMPTFRNKFAGNCANCSTRVAVGAGYCTGSPGNWKTYCENCLPERKGAATTTAPARRELTAAGQVFSPYEPDNLDLYRAMPGAKWNRDGKCWNVSLQPGDRHRLLELADRLDLEVAPELRNVEESRQAQAAHHAGLYPFQVTGVDWMAKGDDRLLGDEMGLGKTVQALCALEQNAACLCIVPASLKHNWANECRKWRPDLEPVILNGRNSFRFPTAGEVVIINYDILPTWLQPKKDHPNAKAWEVNMKHVPQSTQQACQDMVLILDEVHKVKNYKSGRSKKVNGLCRLIGRVWGLSGTPLENRPLDLWGVLSCLEMARTVFGGFNRFLEKMNGQKKFIGRYRRKFVGYEFGTPEPIVPELMRRVMLQRKREDVLPDLPGKVYTTIKVPLPNNLRSTMDDLWNEWGEVIEHQRELPPFEQFSTLRQQLAESRIEAVEEMVEDHEEQDIPLVVFSAHVAPVRRLGSRPGWAYIDGSVSSARRQQIVDDFQAGKLKGVAVTIRAGGVGLTLTRAWKAIFIDLDWAPPLNQQAEDRICRIGQTAPHCEVVRLVSDHVLDEHVLHLIAWKMGLIEAALEREIDAVPQPRQHVENAVVEETQEEFEQRMAASFQRAVASVEGFDADADPDANGWPAIMADPVIPF
jgi:SWI/SNF-related matrix-associated actin-dependent regulator 1 of chromatin subfamily A